MSISNLISLILSDLNRYKDTYKFRKDSKEFWKICLESFIFKSGFQAVLLYRIAHFFYKNGCIFPAWFITRINQFLTSAEIEFNAEVGEGLLIAHPSGIVIGRGSVIGNNCILYQGVTLGTKTLSDIKYPEIGDNVIIFSGAKVLGDIYVGNSCIIGTGTIVTKDVKDNRIVIGVNKIHGKNRVLQT